MKKYFSFVLKIATTVAIFYFLFRDQDLNKLLSLYQDSNALYLVFAAIAILTSIFILSIRWARINKIFNFVLLQIDLFKHYLIAYGFNVFLPSSVGGDIWRIRILNKRFNDKVNAFISPFLERVTGLIAILCVTPLAIHEFGEYLELNSSSTYSFLVFLVIILAVLFTRLGEKIIDYFIKLLTSKKWTSRFERLKETTHLIYTSRLRIIEGVLLSIVAQFLFTYSNYFVIQAFGGEISFYNLYLISIITYVVTTLPISFNGLGVREAAIIWGLKNFGISSDVSSIVAIFITFMALVPSFVGGFIFLLTKEKLNENV